VVNTWEVVAHARSVRQRPDKKTDKADAAWLAALFVHVLVDLRFLTPPAVQAWRDLTRTRVALVQTCTQGQNRISKVLEDINIQVAQAMSDLFGKRGRPMLKAFAGAHATLKGSPPGPWGLYDAGCPSWHGL